jgi:hypothetical protein
VIENRKSAEENAKAEILDGVVTPKANAPVPPKTFSTPPKRK